MPQASRKAESPRQKPRQVNRIIAQLFGTYLDFSNSSMTHPLIALYLFGKHAPEELVVLREEIQWILTSNKGTPKENIASFLIALEGLKQTILHYEAESFEEVMMILELEKKEAGIFLKTLI